VARAHGTNAGSSEKGSGISKKSKCVEGQISRKKIKPMFKKAFLWFTVLIALHADAQKLFSEGNAKYVVEAYAEGATKPDSFAYSLMVKGGNIRTELSSAIGKSVYIYDIREATGAVLRAFGGQKILIPLEKDSWTEICALFTQASYAIQAGDSTIIGYSCKKATAILKDGAFLNIWYTEAINPEIREINFPIANLNGFPMVIEMLKNNDRVVYTIKGLDFDPVPVQNYDIPKSGYRTLKFEDSKKMK
jgi:hypothetical protein